VDKLMVTGVEGLVGGNVALALAGRCDVVGVSARAAGPEGCRIVRCDPHDASELAHLVAAEAPRWLVHCGPLSQSAWDLAEIDPPDGEYEAHLAAQLAAAAGRVGSQVAVVLSDVVFAGPRMFHTETSMPGASGPIAAAARAVERALADTDALVVRTHAYGWSRFGAEATGLSPHFAERCWRALAEGEVCEADAHRQATPILASDLALLIHQALEAEMCGLLHITGAERTSPFRFAAELALAGNFAGRQVRLPTAPPPHRPRVDETSLNTHRVRRELATSLPLLRDGLARFAAQAADGYAPRLTAVQAERMLVEQAA
jgi:dTDP-4-dehydrorhamnose reductase